MGTAATRQEDLVLQEGFDHTGVIDDQGRVRVHVIRPCIGQGKGRHVYRPDMLRENAANFTGWPMYIDHLSEAARRAAGGLPRGMRDIGGIIEESWWDPDVPADPEAGYAKGAVTGWARPFGFAREVIEHDPRLAKTSISAGATGVAPITLQEASRALGLQEAGPSGMCLDVLGIQTEGSVDWVTKEGAGGRVVALMESFYDEQAALDALPDDEFQEWLEHARPELREAMLQEAVKQTSPEGGGEDMAEITPEVLQEALQSEAGQEAITGVAQALIQEAVQTQVSEQLPDLVEAAVEQERDVMRAEVEASANRKVDLRDMRDLAHEQIAEAKLLGRQQESLRKRFDLQENGEPQAELDVVDEVDDDGKTTKTAKAKLKEKVQEAITEQRELLAEANPTRVRGQGPGKTAPGEKEKKDPKDKKDGDDEELNESRYEGTMTSSLLQEAGIDTSKSDPWANI